MMNQAVYEQLLVVARRQSVTCYSEIAPLAGLSMNDPYDRNRIAAMLGEISEHEHAQGRPMLSAVVVHKDNNIPGQGFFTLARSLGLHLGEDDMLFFINELRRVHDYWKEH